MTTKKKPIISTSSTAQTRLMAGVEDSMANRAVIAVGMVVGAVLGIWLYDKLVADGAFAGHVMIKSAFILGGVIVGNVVFQYLTPILGPLFAYLVPATSEVPAPA